MAAVVAETPATPPEQQEQPQEKQPEPQQEKQPEPQQEKQPEPQQEKQPEPQQEKQPASQPPVAEIAAASEKPQEKQQEQPQQQHKQPQQQQKQQDNGNGNGSSEAYIPDAPTIETHATERLAQREHKQVLQLQAARSRAALHSLQGIESTVQRAKYGDVHKLLTDLNHAEQLMYEPLPGKIGKSKLESAVVSRAGTSNARSASVQQQQNGALVPISRVDTYCGSDFKISDEPPKAKTTVAEVAKEVKKSIGKLPVRNGPREEPNRSPSKFFNDAARMPPREENRVLQVAEANKKKVELMLVKPGKKHPPPAVFTPEPKPAKKVPKDFVPAAASPDRSPKHWPSPTKAERKRSEPSLSFSPHKRTRGPTLPVFETADEEGEAVEATE